MSALFRCLLICISVIVINGCSHNYGPPSFAGERHWTAIVAAYEPEIQAIDQAIAQNPDAAIYETRYYRGVRYQLGKYQDLPFVIFASGVSVPNAAMTVQMALDYFPIDRVIMMGIAGAVSPEFTPGDIAIPARWYYHDEAVYANPDPEKPGHYLLPDYYERQLNDWKQRHQQDANSPDYSPFSFIYPSEIAVIKQGWKQRQTMPYFSASNTLLNQAKQAIATTHITMPSGRPINIKVGGNGVTGSVFLDNAQYREWLQRVYHADVTEMESAAVAQVCFVNNVDWLVIRSISDLAGAQQGKNTENVFDAIASGTGSRLLMALLEQLTLSSAP